jgi:hypothetical protein
MDYFCRPAVINLLTSADPCWITTGSRRPLSHFYDLNLKKIHNKQIHKLRNILFNSQTKKYTKLSSQTDGACAAPMNQANVTNLIFNLQFQIPSLLQIILKFSISDFAFLCINFINLLGKII